MKTKKNGVGQYQGRPGTGGVKVRKSGAQWVDMSTVAAQHNKPKEAK